MKLILPMTLVWCLFTGIAQAQSANSWEVVFPTSAGDLAQHHFLQGVTTMHLHMFEDAEQHFRAAQQEEPDFVMAYWGEALAQHRTIWSIHRLDQARAILNRLADTPAARAAKAATPRERDYLAAIELLFGNGDQQQRELAYSDAMLNLSQAYPDDLEAKAWYTLSLMRINAPGLGREQTRSLMASLSLEILASNPRHPGANRYLIQSTDDPENTDLGIIAVNNLREIDTDAAEALHIPSHYYLHHGMWQETAESNWRAFESSMAWVADHQWSLQDLNQHNYGHLLQFANYGFLQSGQLSRAAMLRQRVSTDMEDSGGAEEIAAPFADTHARYLVDLELWNLAPELAELSRAHDLRDAGIWLAIGLGAARSGNLELAREALGILNDADRNPSALGSISARQVESLILQAEGRHGDAETLLDSIAVINWDQPVTSLGVPPRPLKPVLELYGEVLLENGKPGEALIQFEKALTRFRGRTNLLLGAARAASLLGDNERRDHYLQQLGRAWQDADADHPLATTVVTH